MKRGFDTIAFAYDRLTRIVFGKAIAKSQLHFLNRLETCNDILVLGGGTGWWMNDFLQTNSGARITFIDASQKMIGIAASRLNSKNRVEFIHGTHNKISHKKYDAVVLFYFLDLFSNEELPEVIITIRSRIKTQGLWLVSDFVNHQPWHDSLLKIMYRFFKLVAGLSTQSLPEWQVHLRNQGLTQAEHITFYKGFIYSSVYHQPE